MTGWQRHPECATTSGRYARLPHGAFLVVVSAPSLHLFCRVRKAHEPVRVQALAAEPPIESLYQGVVRRFAGPGEVERDAVGVGPQIEVPGDELRALVHTDRPGIAYAPANSLKGRDKLLRSLRWERPAEEAAG